MIRTVRQPDPAPPFEVCCFCRVPTPMWTSISTRSEAEQVACCLRCAAARSESEVPTKEAWFRRERALAACRGRFSTNERAALLKVRLATRHRLGSDSPRLSRAWRSADFSDEATAVRVDTPEETLAFLEARGFIERVAEGLVITELGLDILAMTVSLQPLVARAAKAKEPVTPKSDEAPRWECQGCGAMNMERTGPCVGCRLRGPIRKEVGP